MGKDSKSESGTLIKETVPTLTPDQQQVSGSLSSTLVDLLGSITGGKTGDLARLALTEALTGIPSYQLDPETTKKYYEKSVLAPTLRAFEREVKPRIEDAFAGSGMSFSSLRGNALSNALTDLHVAGQGQLAAAAQQNQSLEAQLAESARQRQLQAYGLTLTPLQAALGYTGQQHQDTVAYFQPPQQQTQSQWPTLAAGVAGLTLPYLFSGLGASGSALGSSLFNYGSAALSGGSAALGATRAAIG